jgi:hypothetical protein
MSFSMILDFLERSRAVLSVGSNSVAKTDKTLFINIIKMVTTLASFGQTTGIYTSKMGQSRKILVVTRQNAEVHNDNIGL